MTALTGDDRTLAGRYRLGERLGRGGMAVVYDALDTRLDRAVAVKVLRADSGLGPDSRLRFEREARAAARLSHPHAVAVYDSGIDGDVAYIVMERLPGTTMADYMRGGPLPAGWVVAVAADVLDALAAAHAAGLTHRDIKPGNILITTDDRAKVADFGIATLAGSDGDLTATGLVVGTAAYLPPERLDGQPASAQGDLYALGVVIYEALAGRKPFAAGSPVALADAARRGQPPDLGRLRPDLPPALVGAVATAMAPDPAARFAGAAEMRRALRAAAPSGDGLAPTEVLPAAGAERPPPRAGRARRRILVALVVAAVMLAAGALVLASSGGGSGSQRSATSPSTAPSPASPTTAPGGAPGTSVAPPPPAAASVATDPQAAALRAAAAALDASGGGGPQAAQILDQVAGTPAPARAAAASPAAAAVQGLHDAGALTDRQYHEAMAPLLAITGAGGGSGHRGKGGGGDGD